MSGKIPPSNDLNIPIPELMQQVSKLKDPAAILTVLNLILPSRQEDLAKAYDLNTIQELLDDPITQRTSVILNIKKLLKDPLIPNTQKLQQIGEAVNEALNHPTQLKIFFLKFEFDHPETLEIYKKIYEICTKKPWVPISSLSNPVKLDSDTAFHKRNASDSNTSG